MKNILLILVGGTICSAVNNDGTLSVSDKAASMLKTNFENSDSPYAKKVHIDTTENMYILSENMTVDKWNSILNTYHKYTYQKSYDGVIIAHGTDTLAYSAAMFSMLLSGTKIPVFFVSSQKRLDATEANGNDNFRYAAECIVQGITPNIYVTYKNPSDNRMYLHLASRLEQCKNYSDDFFSRGMLDITDMCPENCKDYFEKIEKLYPASRVKAMPAFKNGVCLTDCVLLINPYVGINYDAYCYSKFKAVLHGTFHSGTACAEECGRGSLLHMIKQCSKSEPSVDAYISPSKLSGEIYETVSTIGNSNIRFLYGYTTELAYAKLMIAYSLLQTDKERSDFLSSEFNFEKIE